MNTLRAWAQYVSFYSLASLLVACGGGGGGGATSSGSQGGGTPDTPPTTYSVAGTISGLTASGLELNLSSGSVSEAHSPTSGAFDFTFAAELENGDAYTVTIAQQPTGQICSLASASGTITSADVSLVLTCADTPLTVSGSISGLTQGQLMLDLNSGFGSIVLSAGDISFAFSQSVTFGSNFDIAVNLPADFADQPKAICNLDTASGVAGTVDVSSLNLVCRSLEAEETIDDNFDGYLRALSINANGDSEAALSWLRYASAAGDGYYVAEYEPIGDNWSVPQQYGDYATLATGAQKSSVFVDDVGLTSLLYVEDDVNGATDISNVFEKRESNTAVNLSNSLADSNNIVSPLASVEVVIGGERVKLVAVDNNDSAEPVCVYTQLANDAATQRFCVSFTPDNVASDTTIRDLAIAAHVNQDGVTGRVFVVWQEQGVLNTHTVDRLHGALLDLDGSNPSTATLAGEASPAAAYSYKNPQVLNVSDETDIRFAFAYERDREELTLESIEDNFARELLKRVSAGAGGYLDVLRSPQLALQGREGFRWSFIEEDRTGVLINGSQVSVFNVDPSQAATFEVSTDKYFVNSAASFLISHQRLVSDEEGNTFILFRESKRSSSADPRSAVSGVVLDYEVVRLVAFSSDDEFYYLTNGGLLADQAYDIDSGDGDDTRAPLTFTLDDSVLDVQFADNGEAVIAWSQWQKASDLNAVKAIRLALP